MLANAVCQSLMMRLVHRIREQARSHIDFAATIRHCYQFRNDAYRDLPFLSPPTPFILPGNNLKRFTSPVDPILPNSPLRKDSAVLPRPAPEDKSPACG